MKTKFNPKFLLGKVSGGDYIISVAGTPVSGLKIKDVENKIISLPRPLSITFHKGIRMNMI